MSVCTRFDDGSAQVRNIRDPGQSTESEQQEHMTTHRPHRSWCKFCVMGRGVNSPHRRSDAQDDLEGVRRVSMDYGFLGEKESEGQVTPVLVIRERRHKMTWVMLLPKKELIFPGLRRDQRSSLISVGTTELHSHATTNQRSGVGKGNCKREARLCQRDHQWERASPTESSNARWDSWLVRSEQ